MKANKSVISALLGVALLAVPITAAAHPRDEYRNRGRAPAYHQMQAYRQAFEPRTNFAPRMAANNRFAMAPTAPIMPVGNYGNWRWRERDNYPIAPAYNPYPNSYRSAYYPPAYNCASSSYASPVGNYAPQYYGAPMGGGLANMVRQRDNAEYLYQQALRNGNRVRAKHLGNDVSQLNKNIANARIHDGYGPAYGSFNTPYAGNYGNGYGAPNGLTSMFTPLVGNSMRTPYASNYGNGYAAPNGLTSMVAPLLGNYIH